MENKKIADQNYQVFIQKAVENEVVWYLATEKGCAMCQSNDSELGVYLFWGAKSAALKSAKHEWQDYEPKKIKLAEFMEVWCIPLYEQEVLIGANWTEELLGVEINPLDLLKDLIAEIRRQNQEEKLNLLLFDDLCDMELAISEVEED